MKSVAIFGIMASGKTSSGRLLAKKMGYRFYDTDKFIEEDAGMTVQEIFQKKGESFFRKLESRVIKDLSSKKKCVIALGGGAITVPGNIRALKDCFIVSLLSSAAAIIRRTENDDSRPLLNVSARRKNIKELIEKRKPLYLRHAELVIDTSNLNPAEIASKMSTFIKSKQVLL
ncbi:MAG: shikimate kinase [Candidatus Firestonebacteria bacterium]